MQLFKSHHPDYKDGEQARDFVYVKDIAKANILALRSSPIGCDDPLGPIINIGSGKGRSVNEIFEKLSQIIGYNKKPVFGPPKPGEVYKISLSASKAKETLGWEPEVDFDTGLRETVRWFRENQAS
jgi:UDP-glucose 4-epimerase